MYSVVSQCIQKDFLLLTEILELVDIGSDTYHLEYTESFSGALFMTVNFDAYVTLEHAFNEIFFTSNYKSCLITVGINTVAVFMPFPDVFKVFDFHSRDLHGMPCASGYCILTSVEGIQNLAQYFRLTSCSQSQHVCIPFELKGVKCNRRLDFSNRLSNVSKRNDNCQSPIDQDKLKSCVKEKECIWKRVSENVIKQDESFEEKKTRLAKERDIKRTQRKNESSEAREQRLAKQRASRKNESSEAREQRLAKQRANRKNESSEAREQRLAQQRANRKNESSEAREQRLAKQRASRKNESSEAREQMLAKQRANRKNESSEAREQGLAKQRASRKNESSEARQQKVS